MIERSIASKVQSKIGKGKIIVLYGARQVGKTTLLRQLFDTPKSKKTTLWLNGDEAETEAYLDNLSASTVAGKFGRYSTLVIDEAQRIPNIGIKLKIIHDNLGNDLQIVATGSSSFDLANQINEPLTGRKWVFWLYPFSLEELVDEFGAFKEKSNLENRLIYGSYPDVVTHPGSARDIVMSLANDNLYKDVLNLGDIIKTDKLSMILKALSYQIGSQVSHNEIAMLVGLDRKTVEKYLTLLKQAFVIFELPSYSRNLRNELKASHKYYFYDVGIRNALIADFSPIGMRQDIGNLFENYIIAEFEKTRLGNAYFWRNTNQQEIDYVLENNGQLNATEIKWNPTKTARFPKIFLDTYKPSRTITINRDNYFDII